MSKESDWNWQEKGTKSAGRVGRAGQGKDRLCVAEQDKEEEAVTRGERRRRCRSKRGAITERDFPPQEQAVETRECQKKKNNTSSDRRSRECASLPAKCLVQRRVEAAWGEREMSRKSERDRHRRQPRLNAMHVRRGTHTRCRQVQAADLSDRGFSACNSHCFCINEQRGKRYQNAKMPECQNARMPSLGRQHMHYTTNRLGCNFQGGEPLHESKSRRTTLFNLILWWKAVL